MAKKLAIVMVGRPPRPRIILPNYLVKVYCMQDIKYLLCIFPWTVFLIMSSEQLPNGITMCNVYITPSQP